MAGLRPFSGWVFTRAIELIIAGAAVSGGCFPSAHVSGAWALTFGLYATDRRAALWFGLLAVELSIACVYTRYHHAVNVLNFARMRSSRDNHGGRRGVVEIANVEYKLSRGPLHTHARSSLDS
jgi:hypothetical protein